MTPKISFIIGIAFTALAVGVPTALGEGRLAGSNESQLAQPEKALQSPIVSERTVEPQSLRAERLRGEALNRMYGLGEFAPSNVEGYRDASERIVEPQSLKAERARSEGLNRMYGLGEFATTNGYRDAHERAVPPTSSTPVSVTVSDRDIEWPQVGVGLGIGILLAFGLGLTMRVAHVRPFAH
jgi:hypothetical protein